MFTFIVGKYLKLSFLNLYSHSFSDLKYLGLGLAKVRLKILQMDLDLDSDSDLGLVLEIYFLNFIE